ncbi:hypothetical protein [Pseudosulfitobacter sp. DSM 107133]|uniref:hypothetical protein n=1 Tax=Pseudosulfitobacter sp. DSM 107133 TaxID=2883100 RepID=UPI001F079885|nr:hypothetical protein [Pseudosulfitobacter sp. DSM 107133]
MTFRPEAETALPKGKTQQKSHFKVARALDHALAKLMMFDQFALPSTTFRLHQVGGGTVIAVTSWHAFIREMIALQFAEYR